MTNKRYSKKRRTLLNAFFRDYSTQIVDNLALPPKYFLFWANDTTHFIALLLVLILSLRYLFFFSFRFLSFVSNFLFYISIWKTKHVLNSFNIFDWCFEAKMSLWLCVEQRECFEKTDDKISNSLSFVRCFFTHESWFDVCWLLNHFCVTTPKRSIHIKSNWNAFDGGGKMSINRWILQHNQSMHMCLCSLVVTRFLFLFAVSALVF